MPQAAPQHDSGHAPQPQRDQRPSAAARGYDARWRRLRRMVLARQPVCATPGCNRPATDVDHRIAKAAGGDDSFENLVAYCHACHSRKTVACDGGFGRSRRDEQ
jgi:5-methylcytosine-specific restriction enzyme A